MTKHDDIDALAAEYALGTLTHEERNTVNRRRAIEPALDAAIREWQLRLSPLDDLAPGIEPPPELHAAIAAHIAREGRSGKRGSAPQRQTYQPWAFAAAAAVLLLIVPIVFLQNSATPSYRASLQMLSQAPSTADTAPASYVVLKSPEGPLEVSSFLLRAPAGYDHVLWLVRSGGAPALRIAVLPRRGSGKAMSMPIPAGPAIGDAENAILFVTLEREGETPDSPTGLRIMEGKLVKVGR